MPPKIKNKNNAKSINDEAKLDIIKSDSDMFETKDVEKNVKKVKKKHIGKKKLTKKEPAKLNAFQLLMESRKKVIGDNASGKEGLINNDDGDASEQKQMKKERKLFLEKWAEKKGGAKSKELEVVHTEQIKYALKKRKRRFTSMLLNKNGKRKSNTKDEDSDNLIEFESTVLNGSPSHVQVKEVKKSQSKKVCDDDVEFVSKLSPSLKEKNMLKYFKKIDKEDDSSPKSKTVNNTKLKVKKRKTKAKDDKNNTEEIVEKSVNKVNNNSDTNSHTNSKRIRKKVVYAEISDDSDSDVIIDDDFLTPQKKNKKASLDINKENISNPNIKALIVSPIKIINIKSPSQMKCIRSPKIVKDNISEPPEKKIKIAPLFFKSVPKPMIDPQVKEARQKFLYSESPKLIEKSVEILQTTISDNVWFPKHSHVQQIPKIDSENFNSWNLPTISKYNSLLDQSDDQIEIVYKYFNNNKNVYSNAINNINYISKSFDLFKYNNIKEGLHLMKTKYPKFPIYKFFKALKEKFTKLDQNNEESVLWTEKYKPLCSEDIIGNTKSVNALKSWLLSWKECSKQDIYKCTIKKRRNSSSDDFFTSDSESNDTTYLPNNVMIIYGPTGSGKTSTIYAIANELDLNVLEVNASSKRTGKKIMTELQEATQSHKILTRNNSEDLNVMFNTKKHESKNKKHLLKKHKSEDMQHSQDNKMSLMLIEDADIVFDEDDGFITALNQIVQYTKRPVIMVVSNLKCNHIRKFIQDNNILRFNNLSGQFICPWLDLMIFIESGLFVPNLSLNLIDANGGDMRKSILQMQFIISSYKNDHWQSAKLLKNNSEAVEENGYSINEDSNSSWNNNSGTCLANDKESDVLSEIFISLKQFFGSNMWQIIYKDHSNVLSFLNDQTSECDIKKKDDHNLKSVFDDFDRLSIMDVIQQHNRVYNDKKIFPWDCEFTDTLSINENQEEFKRYRDFSESWCCTLMEFNKKLTHKHNFKNLNSEKRWHVKQHSIYNGLTEAVSLTSKLDRSSLALDYIPTLRNICKTEKHRLDTNMKRNNRFYHYLRSLNAETKDSTFDDACEVFKSIN